jgi:hypothetical protein
MSRHAAYQRVRARLPGDDDVHEGGMRRTGPGADLTTKRLNLTPADQTRQPVGSRAPASAQQPRRSQQLLAERFARRDIDEYEYARRLQVLNTGPSGS